MSSISSDVRDESSLHDLTPPYAKHVRVGEDLVSAQGNIEQMKAELDVLTQTSASQRAQLATTLDRMHTESLTIVGILKEDEGVTELKPMHRELFLKRANDMLANVQQMLSELQRTSTPTELERIVSDVSAMQDECERLPLGIKSCLSGQKTRPTQQTTNTTRHHLEPLHP